MTPSQKNRKFALKGLAGLAISFLLVWAISRRVDPKALAEAFSTVRIGWFGAAILTFGLGIAIAGARWRIPLVMNSLTEPWGFVLRMSCVAHCFNVLLMGPVGGDMAKAAFFSRWRRRPGAKALAACVIDRMLAAGGSVFYGLLTVTLVLLCGGVGRLAGLRFSAPGWTTLVGVAAIVGGVVLILRGRLKGNAFVVDSWASFRAGILRFRDSRRMAALGIFLSLLNQVLWGSILAICLFAVAGDDIQWMETLWVFPVVSALASLPVSMAGAGVREGVAVVLLATCGVAEADALAAALLTSAAYLLWALIGAVVGWREELRFVRFAPVSKGAEADDAQNSAE